MQMASPERPRALALARLGRSVERGVDSLGIEKSYEEPPPADLRGAPRSADPKDPATTRQPQLARKAARMAAARLERAGHHRAAPHARRRRRH